MSRILFLCGRAFGPTGENLQRSARQGTRHPAKRDLGIFPANRRAVRIGAMAEFERALIQERVRAGLRNARPKASDWPSGSDKNGHIQIVCISEFPRHPFQRAREYTPSAIVSNGKQVELGAAKG